MHIKLLKTIFNKDQHVSADHAQILLKIADMISLIPEKSEVLCFVLWYAERDTDAHEALKRIRNISQTLKPKELVDWLIKKHRITKHDSIRKAASLALSSFNTKIAMVRRLALNFVIDNSEYEEHINNAKEQLGALGMAGRNNTHVQESVLNHSLEPNESDLVGDTPAIDDMSAVISALAHNRLENIENGAQDY